MHKRKLVFLSLLTIALSGCGFQALHHAEQESGTQVAYNPKASKLNVQLGLGYLQQGKRELAKTKLLTALQQSPNSSQANDAMGYFLESTGNIEQADKYYKKALSYAKGKGAPYNNYGTFLCRQGRYADSESYFLAAVKDPTYLNSADAYENAGLCSLQVPNVEKAKGYFALALKHDPKRPTSLLELGTISFNQGNIREAERSLKEFSEVSVATAESTWLNYQIAKQMGQQSEAASAAMLLKAKFSNSKEYQLYLDSQGKRTA